MGRFYNVTFENVAVTAAQDLVQIIGAAGKSVRIHRVSCGASNTTLPTAQSLSLRCRYLGATVTNGGGSNATPAPIDPGDAAASFTAKVNSTSKASSNGTVNIIEEAGVHIFAGHDFPFPGNAQPVIGPSESFVYELLSTVSGNVNLSGTVRCEESGG